MTTPDPALHPGEGGLQKTGRNRLAPPESAESVDWAIREALDTGPPAKEAGAPHRIYGDGRAAERIACSLLGARSR